MPDYFALLNQPRRPWLDPEALKQRFLSLSAELHPDRVHHLGSESRQAAQDRYTALNTAYQNLREPRSRLRHLLELESGHPPSTVQTVPPDLTDLFVEVANVCRHADALAKEKASATSPLIQVQLFQKAHEAADRIAQVRHTLQVRHESLLEELRRVDSDWNSEPAQRGQIERLYRLFGYFVRWEGQLQERLAQLTF